MGEFSEPLKPHELVEIAKVPLGTEAPKTDSEIVTTAKFAFEASNFEPILPPKYQALENWFSGLHERLYDEGAWIDVSPLSLDYLFQQYGIKRDEELGRNGYNTFGMDALNYLEGLRTMGVRHGFLGSGGWDWAKKDKYSALLLGSSSITTADDFFRFIHAVNPDASATIIDINPLAVELSEQALSGKPNEQVLETDALEIPVEDGSVDFIATNYLVPNLVDNKHAGKGILIPFFKEIRRVLSDEGRLVMVERLEELELDWLVHWAWEQGLRSPKLTTRPSIILNNHTELAEVLEEIPHYIDEMRRANEMGGEEWGFEKEPRDPLSWVWLSRASADERPDIQTLVFKKGPIPSGKGVIVRSHGVDSF